METVYQAESPAQRSCLASDGGDVTFAPSALFHLLVDEQTDPEQGPEGHQKNRENDPSRLRDSFSGTRLFRTPTGRTTRVLGRIGPGRRFIRGRMRSGQAFLTLPRRAVLEPERRRPFGRDELA